MIEDENTQVEDVVRLVMEREDTHDLVELVVVRHGKSARLQVFVDSDSGVTLADCVRLSRAIDGELEARELFEGAFTIEVSSPGIDRPLKTEKEFRRKLGRTISVDFVDTARKRLRGVLREVADGQIKVEPKNKKSKAQSAALEDILEAREYI